MNSEIKPFVITIVGPESSGKTTLARQLSIDLGCPWVPEYAREYLKGLQRVYDESDLEVMAERQQEVIFEALNGIQSTLINLNEQTDQFQSIAHSGKGADWFRLFDLKETGYLVFAKEEYGDCPRPILLVDGGMLGMKIWARLKYNRAIPVIERALRQDVTSMYILCRPVLPWEEDELRESPSLIDRVWIYNHFLKTLYLTAET